MKSIKIGLVIFFLVLVMALLPLSSACTTQPTTKPTTPTAAPAQPEPKIFKYGQVVSITGPMSVSFKGIYDAAKPAADLLNSKGGITVAGQKYNIEVVSADDQSSPAGAVSAYNILTQQGIKYMNAPQFTPANIAMSPLAEADKVIRVVGMIVDPSQFGPEYKYDFTFCTLYQIPPAYEWLVKNYPNVKKVAMCRVDDPGGIIPEEMGVKEAEKRGLTVVAREQYKIGTEDFYPIMTKILEAKPDAIDMVITLTPWAKGIITAARQMGFTGPIFIGCPLGDIHDLISILDPQYATDIFGGSPDVLSPDAHELIRELRPLIEKAQGRTMYMDNIIPLMTLYPLKQAIEAAQSFDTTIVAETWQKMASIDTIFGPGRMGGQELVGSNNFILPNKLPYSLIMDGEIESFSLDSIPFAK